MTTRYRRSLASLPLLLLTPLLAAPRGCNFGDGDVPIGGNESGGHAGTAGDDGTSGSSSVGGSSIGGSSSVGGGSIGGGSGVGGSSSIGGSSIGGSSSVGGGSIGGGAGTGGSGPAAGPCLETLSAFDEQNTHGLEVTREDVDTLLSGDHHASLTWASGGSSDFTLALVGTDVFYVESEPNPDLQSDIDVSCENHLRAFAIGRVSTADGLVDETIPNLALNIAIPTLDGPGPAGERITAVAAATIGRERFRGSYPSAVAESQCFHSLSFNLTVGRDAFNGKIFDAVIIAPCGANYPANGVIGGEAGTLSCDGDCRTVPNPTIVVEAPSCDGIGEQLTELGDETTFARSGNTLSREEWWGCGCPDRSEFVMAWSPNSPLELKLCHDEAADICEAGCEEELSYELTTAFSSADTNEFRFVD